MTMHALADWLLVPLSYPFMQRALAVAVLVGVVCAVLSCYLVLRGWSLMGDAISHGVLPGIVLAVAGGVPIMLGAFAAGLSCALMTGWLGRHSRLQEDAAMGIVLSGMFALGLVLFSRVHTNLHLMHLLFGDMLGIESADMALLAIIAVGTLALVALKWRDLLSWCFDPGHAHAVGLPVRTLHYGLLALLALAAVASLKAVGIVLSVAMLIAPGAIAQQLSDRFGHMLAIACAAAISSCVAGTLISYHIDAAAGPCIVLVQAALFAAAFVAGPKHGVLARRRVHFRR